MAGMFDLLEKVIDATAESAKGNPVTRHIPLQLLVAIPFGAAFGLYWVVKLGLYGEPGVAWGVGLGVMLFIWAIGGVASLVGAMQARKRRAGKRRPANFQ